VPILKISGAIPLFPHAFVGLTGKIFMQKWQKNGENSVSRSFIIFILHYIYYVYQQKGKMDGMCTTYWRDNIVYNTLTF
jgi:hypothetical protein